MNFMRTIPNLVIHFLCCLLIVQLTASLVPSERTYRRLLRTVYRNASARRTAEAGSDMPAEGSIRLTGGGSRLEGNVEIYHMKRWGSICDDEFDMSEGDVICRSLGFPMGAHSVTSNGFFGPGKKIIWMDNLYCKGNEHELHHCPFDGWKIHDCEANEVAGVVCKESSISSSLPVPDPLPIPHPVLPPTTTTTSTTTSTSTTAAAISSPLHRRRHHLQHERGDDSNANQVINLQGNLLQPYLQQQLPHAEPLLMSPLSSSSPSPSSPPPPPPRRPPSPFGPAFNRQPLLPPSSTTSTTTSASYSSASSSNHSQDTIRPTRSSSPRSRQHSYVSRSPLHVHPQQQHKDLSVEHFAVRLNGGRNPYEGRIEIESKDGKWVPVCGDGFDLKTGTIVCRHLNYGYAYHAFATTSPLDDVTSFESSQDDAIIRLECGGKEKLLSECRRPVISVRQCSPNQDNWASVICTKYLPDLIPDAAELESSVFLEDKQMILLQCAAEENCLASSALQTDINTYGKRVAEGHKASFCLEDNDCDPGIRPKYKCADFGDQGISPGCKDIYLSKLDCQWIDITDLEPGVYVFKVTINPEMKVAESSFDNNAAICTLIYDLSTARVHNCTLAPI